MAHVIDLHEIMGITVVMREHMKDQAAYISRLQAKVKMLEEDLEAERVKVGYLTD